MLRHILPWAAVAFAATASGCNGSLAGTTTPTPAGDGGGAIVPTKGTLPCDVDAVLSAHCRTCHGNPTQFGAPMPLVTFADLHAATPSNPSVPVYESVETRTHDNTRPMPQAPNPRLDAADQATIDAWVQSNAPSGDATVCAPSSTNDAGEGTDAGGGDDDAATPDDCVFDTHIAPASPYTMVGSEIYTCYGFDIAAAGKRQVTQIKVRLDNSRIIHHVLLLESPTSTSGVPAECSPGPTLSAPMMYAWAPGGNPLITPPEAGFPQDQTTHYIVQIHYNNAANLPSPTDSTGFDLCTTANLRKYDADVVAFGTEAISIPPRSSATSTSCYTVPASFDGRSFFAAFPHMHQLGTSIDTRLESEGGVTDMGAIASWNFSNQPWLPVDGTLHLGDVIRASCTWNNPGDTTVNFGQATTDEMCFSFTAYYPKTSLSLGWAAPSLTSVPCK